MKWDYTCKNCGINNKKGKINFYGMTEDFWEKY